MSLHAAHFRDAFFSVPGCVRHLCICGAASAGLQRLAPADCTAYAAPETSALSAAGASSWEGIFIALVPAEHADISAWAAACAPLPGEFLMVFLLAEDRDQLAFLVEAFYPHFVPYVYRALKSGAQFAALTRRPYDPIRHAQDCREREDFSAAYQALCFVPESNLDDEARAKLEGLRLRWLHDWARAENLESDYVLTRGQIHAFEAVSRAPGNREVVEALAAIWRYCGDAERARGLMESLEEQSRTAGSWQAPELEPPPMEVLRPAPAHPELRVLLVTHPRPHYGLDVLYDGLYRLLGPEGVVEYPYKATLHGAAPDEQGNYPCHYQHPAAARSLAEITGLLDRGYFDVVLWGDCEEAMPLLEVQELSSHCRATPLWIVDAVDECLNLRTTVEARIGRPAEGYFKREMVRSIDYGPGAYPLPFGYAHGLAKPRLEGRSGLFWAGHRRFGMRRRYIEPIEAWLGEKLDARYDQAAYRQAMNGALVGLNLCGAGFDTVRYWELPAHGVVLLTEDVPLVIPENFRDGVDALIFQTPREALERLAWALAHPEEAAAMGERGRQRFQTHHSNVARARQVLQQVQVALE